MSTCPVPFRYTRPASQPAPAAHWPAAAFLAQVIGDLIGPGRPAAPLASAQRKKGAAMNSAFRLDRRC